MTHSRSADRPAPHHPAPPRTEISCALAAEAGCASDDNRPDVPERPEAPRRLRRHGRAARAGALTHRGPLRTLPDAIPIVRAAAGGGFPHARLRAGACDRQLDLVGRWAPWEVPRAGGWAHQYGHMTAGSWLHRHAGDIRALRTFAAVGRHHFSGSFGVRDAHRRVAGWAAPAAGRDHERRADLCVDV